MRGITLLALNQDKDENGIVSKNEVSEFLGLGYVNAFLNQNSVESRVLAEPITLEDIIRENPSLVGFSVMVSNYKRSKSFSEQLRIAKPDIKIIWGGPQASAYHEEVLLEGAVDYVIVGEGERTALELIESIRDSEDITSVKGLAIQKDGKIVRTGPRERLTSEELDSIDFRLIHSGEYEKFAKHIPHSMPYSEMRFASIIGSRGCWNDCSFCSSNSIWGRRITYRSPENMVAEIEFLVDEKDVNYIFFADDDFLINGTWVQQIADGLLRKGIEVNYHIMASVRSSLRFNNYDLLRRSGCAEITLGVETLNQAIIKEIGKGYDLSVLPHAANEITGHRIHFGIYYMMGYPQQTEEDIVNDYEFISELPFSRIRPSFITPFPGTRFFDYVEREDLWINGHRSEWQVMNCENPVVKSAVSPERLVEARNRLLKLYLQENYKKRMLEFMRGDSQSLKAFVEFQEYVRSF